MHVEKGRFGQFFLFIGLIALVIFFTIDQSQQFQAGFFFAGILLAGVGVFLIWRDWKRPPPANRFRLLRKRKRTPKPDQNHQD
jgi:ABC-type Fe3+ transport system permease subunit